MTSRIAFRGIHLGRIAAALATLVNGVAPGEYSHSLVLPGLGGGASATQLTFVPAH